ALRGAVWCSTSFLSGQPRCTPQFLVDNAMAITTSPPTSVAKVSRRSKMRRREIIEGILYLSPWIIGFIVFVAGPLFASIYLSFTKYNVLRPPEFVGLQNFVYAFTRDDLFLPSIWRTFYYTLLLVPLGMIASLFVAILLNQKLAAVAVWRTLYFLPTLTPLVA